MSDIWKSVLAEIQQNISKENFSTWFPGSELVSMDNGAIVIGVPNVFKMNQMKLKFTNVILMAFEKNGIQAKSLDYQLISKERQATALRERSVRPGEGEALGDGGTGGGANGGGGFGGGGFSGGGFSGGGAFNGGTGGVGGGTFGGGATRTVVRAGGSPLSGSALQTGLNSKFTFSNFVVGSSNELAASVARNIVDNPGVNYNPFFLYGGSGLGKTHLVQAIGNAILERNPKFKVSYVPMSSFYSNFIKSMQMKKTDEFRAKFMKLDMLIIDDFQAIVNKDASQNEFFDIFNSLHLANKHIVITSDRLPEQLEKVDARLASRLTWAGAYDLHMPQFEERCAILRSKADFKGVMIEDEAIEYIAENIQTNVRALEGELDHLLAVADIKQMTPLEVIKEGYVNAGGQTRSRTVAPRQVIERVAKFYDLAPKEMCSKSRVAHIKNARQVAMYILSKDLNMSTPKIALEVGVKDHTTVMHGIKKIEKDLKLNFLLRDQIAKIKEKIYG